MKNSKNPILWVTLMVASAGIALSASSASAARPELNAPITASVKASLAGVKLVEAPFRAAKIVSTSAKADRSAVVRAVVEEVLTQHPTAVAATVRAVLTAAPGESSAVMTAVLNKAPKAYRVAMVVISEISPSSVREVADLVSSERPELSSGVEKIAVMASSVQGAVNDLSPITRQSKFYYNTQIIEFTETVEVLPPPSVGLPVVIRVIQSCYGPQFPSDFVPSGPIF